MTFALAPLKFSTLLVVQTEGLLKEKSPLKSSLEAIVKFLLSSHNSLDDEMSESL